MLAVLSPLHKSREEACPDPPWRLSLRRRPLSRRDRSFQTGHAVQLLHLLSHRHAALVRAGKRVHAREGRRLAHRLPVQQEEHPSPVLQGLRRALVRARPGSERADGGAQHALPRRGRCNHAQRPALRRQEPVAFRPYLAREPATVGLRAGASSRPSVERISVLMSTSLSPGARYWLSWETISRRLSKVPSFRTEPSTTTPTRSRKSCGGTPRETTWTLLAPSVTSNSRFETPCPRLTEPSATCPPSRMVAPIALSPAARSSFGPQ